MNKFNEIPLPHHVPKKARNLYKIMGHKLCANEMALGITVPISITFLQITYFVGELYFTPIQASNSGI